MKITKQDVEHVALLARLELSEGEKEKYTVQLNAILDHMEILNKLDTTDVQPTAHVLPLKNVFREDEVRESMAPAEVLQNAPDREENYFRVPKIMG